MTDVFETMTDRAAVGGFPAPPALDAIDFESLRRAHRQLEHPSLAARLSSMVGTPIEIGVKLLPGRWSERARQAAELAIAKAFDVAPSMLRREQGRGARDGMYKGLAAGSGALGGLFGLPGLIVELPMTTSIMLRSIAEIACFEGEDIRAPETRLACVQVFALGGRSEIDDAAETGYYGARLALAGYIGAAAADIARHGLAAEGSPALAHLIRAIAARFGSEVSRRLAVQLLPLLSAAGGAAVNTVFMQHFQDMARGHFTVRRLERKYGERLVRTHYEMLNRAD